MIVKFPPEITDSVALEGARVLKETLNQPNQVERARQVYLAMYEQLVAEEWLQHS